MGKSGTLILLGLLCTSCIPIARAPDFSENHIKYARKFQRKLPRAYSYIFEDTRKANEFFAYLDYKFDPNPDYFTSNIPLEIEGKQYYLSFYEVEKADKNFNLVPALMSLALKAATDHESDELNNLATSRKGNWYLALILRDENLNDALNPAYKNHAEVKAYLNAMREEYFRTDHYRSFLLTNQ